MKKPKIDDTKWLIDNEEVILKSDDDLNNGDSITFEENRIKYEVVIDDVNGSSDLYIGTVIKVNKTHKNITLEEGIYLEGGLEQEELDQAKEDMLSDNKTVIENIENKIKYVIEMIKSN